MTRLIHLMRKEVLELRQDPRLFGIVVMAPIIQLTVLGYAATTDVKDVPVVIVDADRSVRSRELITRFEASDNFTIVGLLGSTREIESLARERPRMDGAEHSRRIWKSDRTRTIGGHPGRRRRNRFELDQRGAQLRACAGRRVCAGPGSRAHRRDTRASGQRRHPCLVQSRISKAATS